MEVYECPKSYHPFQCGKIWASVKSLVSEAKHLKKIKTQTGRQFISVLRSYCNPLMGWLERNRNLFVLETGRLM